MQITNISFSSTQLSMTSTTNTASQGSSFEALLTSNTITATNSSTSITAESATIQEIRDAMAGQYLSNWYNCKDPSAQSQMDSQFVQQVSPLLGINGTITMAQEVQTTSQQTLGSTGHSHHHRNDDASGLLSLGV